MFLIEIIIGIALWVFMMRVVWPWVYRKLGIPLAVDPNKGPASTLENPYKLLFVKLCNMQKLTPLELFKVARKETGFGWSDTEVQRHFDRWIAEGQVEFPNYVELFLDKVKRIQEEQKVH